MIDWKAIKHDYLADSTVPLLRLARKYGVKYDTVKHHASRNHWANERAHGIKPRPVDNIPDGIRDVSENELEIMNKYGLTDYEQRFLQAYAADGISTKAYREVFGDKGFRNARYASRQAYNIRHRPHFAKAYSEIMRERSEYLTADLTRIMDRAKQVSEASISDFLDWTSSEIKVLDEKGRPILDENGNPRTYFHNEIKLKPRDAVDFYPVEAVTQNNRGDVTIKLSDRGKADDLLIKLNQQATNARLQLAKVKKLEAEATLAEEQAAAVRRESKPSIVFCNDWEASPTAESLAAEIKELKAENAELHAKLNQR